ncbi:AMP-binding protein [Solirubrobacter phytolaccae]|uniref:AMP-binding protein n=1 Tax=Solirubrobacter phytolaccae TaxID=1404360 RepID=A0A9X3S658_9ACTN|nr:AMP-binding protein [Solirubrobacter phytolaccae]MDA0179644.1 AMP-binding protein [Solirubrobacter phytolaccae]
MSDLSWPLARAARLFAGEVAVVDGDRSVTYGELERRVRALGGLDAARVGYLGPNSRAHLECWLGLPAFGKVLVDLNYRLSLDELAFMVRDAGLEALISDDPRAAELGVPLVDYEALVTGPECAFPGVAEDSLAAISYTGGTTGTPKGVMLSHRNLLSNALHNLAVTGHAREDRWLHVCPMFHVAGTSNVFACVWVGATSVILPRFEPVSVLETIASRGITHSVFVPTMLAMLLEEASGFDVSSLRHLQYAASPISPELQRRVLEWLPDCDVVQFYGMTEAAPTVTRLSHADHTSRPSSMGRVVPGVQAEVRAARGEVGELWVRGPNVMLGYWNRPEATEAALVDGWYRTGDLAREDEEGYFFMVDRAKDMIITGGENVYSVEVEAVLSQHPRVDEVAVFGVPSERWGEAVHAVVVARAGVSEEELIAWCRESLGGFKVPRSITFSDEPLPKSGAGKLLKARLREPFWEGRERRVG